MMVDNVQISRSQKRNRRDTLNALEATLSTPDGSRTIRWIMEMTGALGPAENTIDEGKRRVGLELIAAMNEIDPHAFVRLMRDGANDIVRMRADARKELEQHV